jgi:hypothetical protein
MTGGNKHGKGLGWERLNYEPIKDRVIQCLESLAYATGLSPYCCQMYNHGRSLGQQTTQPMIGAI